MSMAAGRVGTMRRAALGSVLGVCALALLAAGLRAEAPAAAPENAALAAPEYAAFFGLVELLPAVLGEDPDGDGLTVNDEATLGTDPWEPDTDGDGWWDDEDLAPLSRARVAFAHPRFVEGSLYRYPGPTWWLGALRQGGEVDAEAGGLSFAADTPSDAGSVVLLLDPVPLTNGLVLELDLEDGPGAALHVDLLGDGLATVVADLAGNAADGTGARRTLTLDLSLPQCHAPAGLRLRCGPGPITLFGCLLYADGDRNGVDDQQELQWLEGPEDNAAPEVTVRTAGADGDGPAHRGPRTLHVNVATGDDARDGLAAVLGAGHGPKRTVRAALAVSEDGDTVEIAAGRYAQEDLWRPGEKCVTLRPMGTVTIE